MVVGDAEIGNTEYVTRICDIARCKLFPFIGEHFAQWAIQKTQCFVKASETLRDVLVCKGTDQVSFGKRSAFTNNALFPFYDSRRMPRMSFLTEAKGLVAGMSLMSVACF